jgi:hypothetical protein
MDHSSTSRFPQLFLGLMLIAAALVLFGWSVSKTIRQIKQSNQLITVSGVATKKIQSNYVVWKFSVKGKGTTLQHAYQRVGSYTASILSYLNSNQIPRSEIMESPLMTNNIQQFINGQMTGYIVQYQLIQNFEIRSHHVNQIAAFARHIYQLINQGIPIVSQSPQFLYTDLGPLRVQMLTEATKDAKARAVAIAGAAGDRIGVLRSVNVGLFQVTSPGSTEVSAFGQYSTSTIEKQVSVVESASFQIRQ